MARPRIVEFPPELLITRPFVPMPANKPFNSMIGVPVKSGSVVPSMITDSEIDGSAEVGWIV